MAPPNHFELLITLDTAKMKIKMGLITENNQNNVKINLQSIHQLPFVCTAPVKSLARSISRPYPKRLDYFDALLCSINVIEYPNGNQRLCSM